MASSESYKNKITDKESFLCLLRRIESDDFETEEESNAAVEQIARSSKCSNPFDVIFFSDASNVNELYDRLMTDDSIKL
ncbi:MULTISPECIES: hypothetical protein [Pseudoalteromonas]|uniref:hypothetical protein n=1 Tax=Pseudoalteromonas TaxID=53246 RepID=UPI001581FEB9|nr:MULTISPECIES: hypothetical protein [Pseudoalteromonas]MDI4652542.1 bacteriocin immunity protein [Pseudoalteromonas shioyasakiensis]NUJ38750.1 hypothetical protein [Pseudoalteromonas sp. 0303]